METQCSQEGCEAPAVARGLCSRHYQRFRYRGALDDVAPAPSQKVCANCGRAFNPKARRWGAIYCSHRCNDAARYERKRQAAGRRTETCEQCGGSMQGKRPQARFCSDKCGNDWTNTHRAREARAVMLANRRPCHGCSGSIPEARRGGALYCSDECKSRSRRHQAYGLTKQELDLLLAQHEVCAICGTDDWGRKGPAVDHDHATGAVRGILCGNCNQGLGRFRDDPSLLRAAVAYLERS